MLGYDMVHPQARINPQIRVVLDWWPDKLEITR